jgi:hypothetical protein
MSRYWSVPPSVLDMQALTAEVEACRAALEARTPPNAVLVEFEVCGNWFGSIWRYNRYFKWMIYVALVSSDNEWIDHAEDLVRRSRWRADWVAVQTPESALEAAKRFANSRLDAA